MGNGIHSALHSVRRLARSTFRVPLLPNAIPFALPSYSALALLTQHTGPESYVEAASHFYRALRMYPNPVELLMSE